MDWLVSGRMSWPYSDWAELAVDGPG